MEGILLSQSLGDIDRPFGFKICISQVYHRYGSQHLPMYFNHGQEISKAGSADGMCWFSSGICPLRTFSISLGGMYTG